MAKLQVQTGSVSQTVNVFIRDSSSVTGAGLTGLVFNSASLSCYYALPRAAAVAVTLVTLAAVTTGWTSGGFKEIDATNMPGWYRLDIPNAAFASGRFVDLLLKGAANMVPVTVEIELTATNNQTTALIHSGTAQAGSTTSITLAASASATNGLYDPAIVRIVAGTGAGQQRGIAQYDGTSKVATVDRDWRVAPDSTSVYDVLVGNNPISTNEGNAQAGGASTITLNTSASSIDNTYNGQTIVIRTGLGQDQSRVISSYVGSTKVATVAEPWTTAPNNTSGYQIWPTGRAYLVGGNTDSISAAMASAAFVTKVQAGLATPTNITSATGITVAAIGNNVITAAAIAGSALNGKGDWLLSTSYVAPDNAAIGATYSLLTAVASYVDTEVGAIKSVTDRLDALIEADGGGWRFTTNALEQAPTGGGGGSSDWTANERTAIRAILGIPGSGTTPDDPSAGILDAIRDLVVLVKAKTDNLPSDPADQSLVIAAVDALSSAISSLPGAVWNVDVPAAYAAGKAGHYLGNLATAMFERFDLIEGAALKRGTVEPIPFDMYLSSNKQLAPGKESSITVKVRRDEQSTWFNAAGTVVEAAEGSYDFVPDSTDTSAYRWTSIKFLEPDCETQIVYFKMIE